MSGQDAAIEFEGRTIAVDAQGYLRDRRQWSEPLAHELARRDGLSLGDDHLQILQFLRQYYDKFGLAPPMRLLTRALADTVGAEKASSRALYRLFPDGPAKQACRYAGLPRPLSCI